MFSDIWNGIVGFFSSVLEFFHDVLEPIFGDHSWGWAIIALTLVVRIVILPLAVKQFRSMRAMQALQPQLKALQKKHKVDRELMRKDPEQYRAKKQKLNEEMMALYQREGANPAASCLPLLAQAPIFIALFWTIRGMDELNGAPFYFFTNFISSDSPEQGLAALVSATGWPGWLLIIVMSGTMFLTQKQMMARNAATQVEGAPNVMAQQQKILLYVMPIFLAVISFNFPLGLLVYWCTTNIWQVAQQAIILREVRHEAETGELAEKPGGEALKRFTKRRRGKAAAEPDPDPAPRKRSPGASSGKKPAAGGSGADSGGGAPSGDDAPATGSGTANGRSTPKTTSEPKGTTKGTTKGKGSPNGQKPGGDVGTPSVGATTDADGTTQDPPETSKPRTRDHLPRRGGAGRN